MFITDKDFNGQKAERGQVGTKELHMGLKEWVGEWIMEGSHYFQPEACILQYQP